MNIVDNAGEAIEPRDGEEQEEQEVPTEDTKSHSDPLDAIEDEAVRNDMKRLRAIDQRAKKKFKEEEAQPTAYATKDDLKLMATYDAKKMVAPEVKEMWDELTKIPLGGYDPMDSESIADNMRKRYNLYLIDNPVKEDDPVRDFITSPNMSPSSKGTTSKSGTTERKDPPGYKEPVGPEKWYPEKS